MRVFRALQVVCLSGALLGAGSQWSGGAEFEVFNTMDGGYGSLRQAILDANDNPGADRIVFNIPGDGVRTIRPLSDLPAVLEAVEIDGYSQAGARPNTRSNGFDGVLLVQLDGGGTGGNGLSLEGNGLAVVRGLVINRFGTGIYLNSPSNIVAGNFIGIAPDGTNLLANSSGIRTSRATGCQVGGVDPKDRNVITTSSGRAIYAGAYDIGGGQPAGPTNLMVLGNFLGTDATGLVPLPRGSQVSSTISIQASEGFVLGGLEPGAGNVIATGGNGVHLYSIRGTRVLGNYIGVGIDGRTSIRNTNGQFGILLDSQSDARIERNTIAGCNYGMRVFGGPVTILQNRIYSNNIAGIQHGGTFSPNDPGDLDTGPNELQNYPTLQAILDADGISIVGELMSQSATDYHIEFFAASGRGTNGHVQGEWFLGSIEVTTSAAGLAEFALRYPHPGPGLDWITATATDPAGNTSVFFPGVLARSETFLHVHQHPSGAVVLSGTNFTLRAEISGAAPITYQWRRNGEDVPGATNTALSLTNVQGTEQGTYQLVARNPLGSVETQPAELTVLVTPQFIYQPLAQIVAPGEWVTVSAGLSEFTTPPIGFRWRSNNVFVTHTVGAQWDTYFTYRAAGSGFVTLAVVATNPLTRNAVISSTVAIVVAADRDGDGLPDDYETRAGLNPDDPGDAADDPDGDGVETGREYTAGTDPFSAASVLKVDRLTASGGTARLEFTASSNKTYRVEYRDVLEVSGGGALAAWQTLASVPARRTNGPVTIIDSQSVPERFYRLATPHRP